MIFSTKNLSITAKKMRNFNVPEKHSTRQVDASEKILIFRLVVRRFRVPHTH